MTVYLLVLAENIRMVAIIIAFAWVVLIGFATIDAEKPRLIIQRWCWIPLLAAGALTFIPGPSQLREAFILTEFSKVGTADNAKIVAARIETLIKLFAEKK